MTPVSTRLVRLLNMVPYFQANPRVTRAQAAADLGVSVEQLGEDLDQLWLCGLPGYSPGDLIDFGFEGDTIEVTFSERCCRPSTPGRPCNFRTGHHAPSPTPCARSSRGAS